MHPDRNLILKSPQPSSSPSPSQFWSTDRRFWRDEHETTGTIECTVSMHCDGQCSGSLINSLAADPRKNKSGGVKWSATRDKIQSRTKGNTEAGLIFNGMPIHSAASSFSFSSSPISWILMTRFFADLWWFLDLEMISWSRLGISLFIWRKHGVEMGMISFTIQFEEGGVDGRVSAAEIRGI